MPFTTLPIDLMANSDPLLTVGGRAADISYSVIGYDLVYIRKLSHAYILPSVSHKQFQ